MSNYKSILQSNNEALSANNLDLQSLIEQANNLPDAGGVELPTLTNEGTASELFSGKQLIDGDGNIVTGSFSIDSELNTQDDLITQIQSVVDSLPEAETPVISVSSGGLITATAGNKSAIKQLTIQGAQTITPSTTDKTIASGRYLTGTQTIKGDANLIAGNIKNGVSIFGVNGTYAGSGGGSSGSSGELCTITFYDPNDVASEGNLYCIYLSDSGDIAEVNVSDGIEIYTYKNSFIIFTTSDYRFMPACADIYYEYSGVVSQETLYSTSNGLLFGFLIFGDGTTGSITIEVDNFDPFPI